MYKSMPHIGSLSSRAPGTWKSVDLGERISASFTCPLCGQLGTLEDYEIKTDGIVEPSMICPSGVCSFHDHIQLVGWVSTESVVGTLKKFVGP